MDREFSQQVEAAQDQLRQLLDQVDQMPSDEREVAERAVETLSLSLEELHVAEEELRQQNEELVATREALEEERRRYQNLFSFAPDGYLVTDAKGVIREANRAAAGLFGVQREHLAGKPLALFMAEEERAAFYAQITRLRAGREQQQASWETRMQSRDDAAFHAALTTSSVHDEAGELSGIRWLIRDITARVEAEEALRESEERYRSLYNSIRDAILVADTERNIIDCNPAFSDLFGYTLDEIEGKKTHYVYESRNEYEQLGEAMKEHMGDPSFLFTVHYQKKSGEVFPGETNVFYLRDDDGNVTGFIGLIRDVTERERIERELRESQAQYRQLAESAEAILWEYDVQADRWTYVAPQVTRILGCPPEAWTDLQFWVDHLHPEDREWALPYCLECANRGEPHTFEYRFLKKDGSVAWIRDVVSVEMKDGHPVKLRGFMLDITERKRMEEALRESEGRFATVMNSIEAFMYVADIETYELLFVNRYTRDLFGDVEGQVCWQVLQEGQAGPCDFCTNVHLFDEHGEPTGIYTWEFQNTRTGRWYNIQDRAIRWVDGRWARLEMAIDITEHKQVEEEIEHYAAELERSNEELEQFAHVISHDLREPARMVKSYLELLENRYQGQLDEKADKFIDYAVDGAERMQEMIKALLDLSRIGTRGKEPAPTDAEAVLERALRSLGRAIEEVEAEVTHDPLPTVMADQAQLAQVFQNLIANGIKFRREDVSPQVHVSAEQKGDEWLFLVEDNGIGIDPGQADRLFQIFQRLHTQEEYEGTGIGLALCKRIVERHGGRIWVDSEAGEGSTFYFTIPARKEG